MKKGDCRSKNFFGTKSSQKGAGTVGGVGGGGPPTVCLQYVVAAQSENDAVGCGGERE